MTTKTTAKWKPLDWQIAPFLDKSKIMLLTGSAGGGKSRVAAEKLVGYCFKYPGTMAMMLRKTRESMTNSTVLFMDRTILAGVAGVRHYPSKNRFEFVNGSILAYGGMKNEEQREQIRSVGQEGGVDIVWMEEANKFIEDDFQEVLPRLRGRAAPWRQIVLTTNPDAPFHWIYTRLILGKQATVYYSSAMDNRYNPAEYIETLGSLTGVMGLRLREGKWVQAEGAIYTEFDARSSDPVHVKRRDAHEFQYWMLALDEGYTNPAVILLIGIDSDARMHIQHEFYETGKLQDVIIAEAAEVARSHKVAVAVVDASAASLIAALRNAGIPAQPHKGRVLDGIGTVQSLLRVAGDGRPRLTIDPNCYNTISEFENYSWKPGKDEPVKRNDHAMDALRYAAGWLYLDELDAVRITHRPVRIGPEW